MLFIDQKTWQRAKTGLDRALSLHLYDPNVSHIDLGLRIVDKENYRIKDELVVRVHLRKKLRGEAFQIFANQYPDRVIDENTIGFPIDLPEARYRLNYLWRWASRPAANDRSGKFEVMEGGISISHEYSSGYGTLGGKVIDGSGEEYILSNWHVLVGSWESTTGQAIYQPARWDGGTAAHAVANLARDAMKDNLDAAIARVNRKRRLVNKQFEMGPVRGVGNPKLGMVVEKSGRGSAVTRGIITGISGQSVLRYDGLERTIKHIVHIAPMNAGTEVSAPGDSGAWWIEETTRRVIGLHFAGANDPEYALAISMPEVLSALNVEVALQ